MSNFDSQIEYTPVEKSSSTSESVQRTDVLKVGAGSNRFEVNLKEGLFLGANTFLDAPARIGFDGSALFSSVVITNDAGDIIIDEYGTKMIADAVITTAAIADGAVDTEKLAALAVEAANLADSAVTTTKIANLAVGSAAIQALAVGTAHIANSAIINAKIANAAITNAKINDLSADKINAGTLIGRTVKTGTNTTGGRAELTTAYNQGVLYFYYDNVAAAALWSSATGQGLFQAEDDIILAAGENIRSWADDDIIGWYGRDDNNNEVRWGHGSSFNTRARLDDDGDFSIDGSYDDGGADYAEYFENKTLGEIPKGTSITLNGDKVCPAKEGDIIIGVISISPTMIGNNGLEDCDSWHGKYLKDENDQYVYEEIDHITYTTKTENGLDKKASGFIDKVSPGGSCKVIKKEKKKRKKLNPNYKEDKEFIPRKDRPKEWSVVGLMGQMRVLKGQPVDKRWIKMKEVNKKYNLYLVR